MTVVMFKFGKDQADGTITEAGGNITCVPTRSRVIEGAPDTIVIPAPFTEPFTGAVDIPLTPSGVDWCWKISITVTGITSLVEYVNVPNAAAVDYADLTRVDPETLEPGTEPDALWWAKLNDLIALGGIPGDDGADGTDGTDGTDGLNGKNAYQLALELGYSGTLTEWLESLAGTDGVDGDPGQSAYELAVAGGYVGTLTEWLVSLRGEDDTDGTNGTNGTNGVDGVGLPATSTGGNIVRRNLANTAYETVIPDDAVPARLAKFATQVTDWNLAVTNGWFYSVSGAANSPTTGNFIGQVVATGTAVTQEIWAYTSDTGLDTKTYRRDYTATVWATWDKLLKTRAELDLRYAQIGRGTPYAYGAIGDNIADDTVAMNAFFAATDPNKSLGGGKFRVTANLNCSVNDLRLVGPGLIRGDTVGMDVLNLTGTNAKVTGVTIDGGNKARYGIYATGAGTIIDDNNVSNLYSATSSPRAIYTSTAGGVKIRRNHIANVNAPGNSTQGDSNGLARGIVVHMLTAATAPSFVVDNVIDNVIGEEADGIAILCSDTVAVNYLPGYILVARNEIRNNGRRYIKVQASNVRVQDNWCWALPGFTPVNPSNIIDIIQGSNNDIIGNRVDEMLMLAPISIIGDSVERISNMIVRGNQLKEGDGTNPCIYVAYADNVTIDGNDLTGGSYYVNGGTCNDLVVGHNTCRGGNLSNPAFSFTSSAYGKVGYNALPTGRPVGTASNVTFVGNW